MIKKRRKVSLSNYRLLTCDMGQLLPAHTPIEVLPGDSFRYSTTLFARVAPLDRPLMHTVIGKIWHFFVPARILWTNFQSFIVGFTEGSQTPFTTALPSKTDNTPGFPAVGTLYDFMGVPSGGASGQTINNFLPFRGYQMIWREHFMDRDLQTAPTISLADGPDTTTTTTIQRVCWEKDRFTTCRPFSQRGDAVQIPMSDDVDLGGVNVTLKGTAPYAQPVTRATATGALSNNEALEVNASGQFQTASNINQVFDPNGSLETVLDNLDMSDAGGTILALREAVVLQRYRERLNRTGSRFTEYLMAAFGVKSPDARLQRPELIGYGQGVIQFSEVLQTSEVTDTGTSDGVGVGEMSGHGITSIRSRRGQRFFSEHGYFYTLFAFVPKTLYSQAMEKIYLKSAREDFYDPDLALLGDQPVLKQEAYRPNSSNEILGYNQNYYEYESQLSSVANTMRTTDDNWHMSREFGSDVELNSDFVSCVPTDRIYQSPTEPELFVTCINSIQARRPIRRTARPAIL